MPSSSISSPSCATCRIEWRPSRWPVAAMLLLAVAAPAAVVASAVPDPYRVLLAGAVSVRALALARRERERPRAVLDWAGGDEPARIRRESGELIVVDVRVEFRGALVRLLGRDDAGRVQRLLWWPDTLAEPDRRRLALAARGAMADDIPLRSMAA